MAQAADSGREPSTRLSRVANKWAYCHISLWMISDTNTSSSMVEIVFCSRPSSQNFLNSSLLQCSRLLQDKRLSLILATRILDSLYRTYHMSNSPTVLQYSRDMSLTMQPIRYGREGVYQSC